jgi:predicted RNase H-like HicB family nuclease
MRYPIAIEPGTDRTSFGVVVPDLPGCYSAGDSLDEAIANAEEAIAAWIDATLDSGARVPPASTLDAIRDQGLYAGWIFAVINVDAAMMDDRVERINITLPRRVLRRLDAAADAVGESRSGFIATMTLLRAEVPTPRRKIKSGEPRIVGRRARQVPPVKGKPRG